MTEEQEEAINKHLEALCFVVKAKKISCDRFFCTQCDLYDADSLAGTCATIKDEYFRKHYPELTL